MQVGLGDVADRDSVLFSYFQVRARIAFGIDHEPRAVAEIDEIRRIAETGVGDRNDLHDCSIQAVT